MDYRRPDYSGILTKDYDPLEVKAQPDQGLVDGFASLFGVLDSYGEVTARGAFANTIGQRRDRIHLRYEHEHTIGTHKELEETHRGLRITGFISDDGSHGSTVRRHLADGVQYGISIGFRRIADRSATDDDIIDVSSAPTWAQQLPRSDIRVLTEIKLYENSLVSFPACDPALVESYRSGTPDIAALIAAVKAGSLTDDQTAQLKSLFDSPADLPGTDGEMLADVRSLQTVRRQRNAELIALRMKLHGLGVAL